MRVLEKKNVKFGAASGLQTMIGSSARRIRQPTTRIEGQRLDSTSLSANLFRLVETVANCRQLNTYRRRDETVASRRRRRCVLGIMRRFPH